MPKPKSPAPAVWTFLTNYATVLMCLAADPGIRMRDIAARIGLTERAVQRLIADLHAQGYVTIRRVGRRNQYLVNKRAPLRQAIMAHRTVGEFLHFIAPPDPANLAERKA